jgi:hypothetical protein
VSTAGAISKNMLDALPLLLANTVTETGSVEVIGAQLYRAYTPNQLAINSATFAPFGSFTLAVASPYLDLSGVDGIVLTIHIVNLVVPVTTQSGLVVMQFRQGPTDVPPAPGALYNRTSGCMAVGGYTIQNAAIGVRQRCVCAFSSAQLDVNALNYSAVGGSRQARMIITTGGPAGANHKITAYLEAST